jgi:hypothetical protein
MATFYTKADNFVGPPPIPAANTDVRVSGLSTAERYTWETPAVGYGDFIVLTTDTPREHSKYGAEMVSTLLQLKARGPVAKFKNAREALKRLLPSK